MWSDKAIEAAGKVLYGSKVWSPSWHAREKDRVRAALEAAEAAMWEPIHTAPDISVNRSFDADRPMMTTETLWVRDADGRVYAAWYVDTTARGGRLYWWDLDDENECAPVEWMPHPLWKPE
jgi:hypothetical protein